MILTESGTFSLEDSLGKGIIFLFSSIFHTVDDTYVYSNHFPDFHDPVIEMYGLRCGCGFLEMHLKTKYWDSWNSIIEDPF